MDIFNYNRAISSEVDIASKPLGGENPIRVQTMTDTSTKDVDATIAQIRRASKRGAEYVRLTTQGIAEVESLKTIREKLRSEGETTPLVADIHFNPAIAYAAAKITDKIRVNPGNFTDNSFAVKETIYNEASYNAEIEEQRTRFIALLDICRQHNTAIRVGVNHGSLSSRIVGRYGNTPRGIVESCMEFLRVCKDTQFSNVVVSIKASNTMIMVQSVRLLHKAMREEGINFPLHLGVTEAGEGEDGRIKSAVGIGALLSDGIGDTIRVSLSEPPEDEIPVAQKLVAHVTRMASAPKIEAKPYSGYIHSSMQHHKTVAVRGIGGDNKPITIQSGNRDCGADYIYLPNNTIECVATGEVAPLYSITNSAISKDKEFKFISTSYSDLIENLATLNGCENYVVIGKASTQNRVGELRAIVHTLIESNIDAPVVLSASYNEADIEQLQLKSSVDLGTLLLDGFGDGIEIYNSGIIESFEVANMALSILQASRRRISKTEYISCPGCGRTMYNLHSTIAKVKAATAGMVGLKIGIMGCIVNGPGEMADADYGYVGSGKNKINLYRGQVCVEKNIPQEEAVEHLLALINSDREEKI